MASGGGNAFRRQGRGPSGVWAAASGSEPGLSLPAASWLRAPGPCPAEQSGAGHSSSGLGLIYTLRVEPVWGTCGSGREPGRAERCWVPSGAWFLSQEHAGTFFQATGAVHLGKLWPHCAGSRCHWHRGKRHFLMLLPTPKTKVLFANPRAKKDYAGAFELSVGATFVSSVNYLLLGFHPCC